MANEIALSVNLSAQKGGVNTAAALSITQDMAGDQMIQNVQIVGTSNEALLVGDVTATGWQLIKNLDTANYVEIFLDSGNTNLVSKLLAGEFTLIKPGAAVYARANTAACNCLVVAIEL